MTERHRHVPNSSRRSPPASHTSHDFAVLAQLRDRLPFSFRVILIVYHGIRKMVNKALLRITGVTQRDETLPGQSNNQKKKENPNLVQSSGTLRS